MTAPMTMELLTVRRVLAIGGLTGALLLGGNGVAHSMTLQPLAPASVTTLAQAEPEDAGGNGDTGGDNTGLWGLAGLLGLLGLLGLKRRSERPAAPLNAPGHRPD